MIFQNPDIFDIIKLNSKFILIYCSQHKRRNGMREKRQRKTLPVVLATAVIVTMCFAGIHLTANAASGNRPGTPKITKATAGQTSVKLTWSKAKKARGYIVYMYNGRKYVKIKTLKARTYTVKNLKAYATYKFRVRAYNNTKRKTYYGGVSNTKKINTKAAHDEYQRICRKDRSIWR